MAAVEAARLGCSSVVAPETKYCFLLVLGGWGGLGGDGASTTLRPVFAVPGRAAEPRVQYAGPITEDVPGDLRRTPD